MIYNLFNNYGPIISDEESELIYKDLSKVVIDKNDIVTLDFKNVIAMSTKSAKRIFGSLYSSLSSDKFYEKIIIKNASQTLQEIIYDSIVSHISNIEIKS